MHRSSAPMHGAKRLQEPSCPCPLTPRPSSDEPEVIADGREDGRKGGGEDGLGYPRSGSNMLVHHHTLLCSRSPQRSSTNLGWSWEGIQNCPCRMNLRVITHAQDSNPIGPDKDVDVYIEYWSHTYYFLRQNDTYFLLISHLLLFALIFLLTRELNSGGGTLA